MKDILRESFSYWGLYKKMFHAKRIFQPQKKNPGRAMFTDGRVSYSDAVDSKRA